MNSPRGGTLLMALFLLASSAWADPQSIDASSRFEMILSRLHSDHAEYVGSIRNSAHRHHPPTLYMGLVRPGGDDPTRLEDAPMSGRGVLNDIVVYSDSLEAGRNEGWAALLIDHEYFHARHLARGDDTPMPSFTKPAIQRHYLEAVAWGFNLRQAQSGAYASLTHADYREAFRNYSMHFEAFRNYILRRDQPAWAYYQRFLPDPWQLDRLRIALK